MTTQTLLFILLACGLVGGWSLVEKKWEGVLVSIVVAVSVGLAIYFRILTSTL